MASEPTPTTEPSRDLGARILRNSLGLLLLLLGIAGLFLPFLQGILMIGIGLLFIDLPIKGKAHRWLLRYGWYQKLARQHDKLLAGWRRKNDSDDKPAEPKHPADSD